jgi:Zn-dependent peptidase ImmA (M78 family)
MANVAGTLRALSLQAGEIASRTRLTPERVQEILGGAPVTASELRALARGLKLSMRAFTSAGSPASSPSLGARFRAPGVAESEREPTLERLAGFVDAALKVLPARERLPDWLDRFGLKGPESYAEAERLAGALRAFIYPGEVDSPAIDLPQRLRLLDGLIVSQLKNSKYEGASVAVGGYLFVFVSPRFPARMLFTLGHELGHVVAHHSLQSAHLDLATSIGNFRNRAESFADAFSSAFLLPAQAVGGNLQAIRAFIGATSDEIGDVEILILARIHGVPFDVAARRCEDLELLPRGGATSLSGYLREHHQNPEKRARALNLPQREPVHFDAVSPVLMKFVHESVASGVTSPSWIADRLSTSIESIYETHASMSERRAPTH